MNLKKMAEKNVGWLIGQQGKYDSVMSTRIRMARNLTKYNFPALADENELENITNDVFEACAKTRFLKTAKKFKLNELSKLDKKLLIERHLISHQHAQSSRNAGLIFDDREQVSIMVNEEDHLRIQYISKGLNLFDAWDVINSIDDELSKNLDFAFSEKWGYLTSCPTNTGTGLRASCQVHLPGLGMANGLRGTIDNINKLGMVVRGIYGEGTKMMGNIVQISNQVTLGISEQKLIESINRLIIQVNERENNIRKKIVETNFGSLKSVINKSKDLLLDAEKISFEKSLDLLSYILLGSYLKILKTNTDDLYNLLIRIQPAHIQEIMGMPLPPGKRDSIRAELIKNLIGG